MDNTNIPLCPYCRVVVPGATDTNTGLCKNCNVFFRVIKSDDGTYTTLTRKDAK